MYGSLSYEGLGFTYYVGDEFGDYYELSYGVGPVLSHTVIMKTLAQTI